MKRLILIVSILLVSNTVFAGLSEEEYREDRATPERHMDKHDRQRARGVNSGENSGDTNRLWTFE